MSGIVAVFVLAFLTACDDTSPDAPPPVAETPNLIFIMADDLGKGLLPIYGAEVDVATPNLDRLAREGVVFDNAWATPLCLTTRTELITGRYPTNNGIAGNVESHESIFFDPQYLPSFAIPLRQAGYATALAGKWHGKSEYQSTQVLRASGFEQWMLLTNQNNTFARTSEGRVDFEPGDFPADRLADFVVDFIGEHRTRPFFVYYPMDLIHRPLVATPDAPEATSDSDKVIAMAEYADKMVGRVLDAVETNGLRDNTIIFFSGDNGLAVSLSHRASALDAVWNKLRRWLDWATPEATYPLPGKNLLKEAGINVPLIVGGGPVTRRGRVDALTDFTDVLPTLAALAGATLPDDYAPDGHSIADFLLGQAEDTPRQWIASAAAVYPVLDRAMRSACRGTCNRPAVQSLDRSYWREKDIGVVVRNKRYKLWHHGNGLRALFDLQADPNETVDLWDSADPQAVAAKRRLLAARRTLPAGDIYVKARRFTPDYGLHSHWRLDRPLAGSSQFVFVDWIGGYDAEADARPRMARGKIHPRRALAFPLGG